MDRRGFLLSLFAAPLAFVGIKPLIAAVPQTGALGTYDYFRFKLARAVDPDHRLDPSHWWEVRTHTTPSIKTGVVARPDVYAETIEDALKLARVLYPDATRWTINMPEPAEGWDNCVVPLGIISIGASNPPRLRDLGRWTPEWIHRLTEETQTL